MKHIVTDSGFEVDIDEQVLDDMELFDALVEFQAGDATLLPFIVKRIFGAKKQALYDHCRDLETGRVPTMAVSAEITEIFEKMDSKNS